MGRARQTIRTLLPSRASRVSGRELLLFGEAVLAVAVASVSIRLLPFKVLVRLMEVGKPRPHRRARPAEIRNAVKRASRRVPWKSMCFQEGLALHWMLRRRGSDSVLHYGVRQFEGRLTAHVWVSVEGEIVIGEETRDPHLCLAAFPNSGRRV